MFRENKRTIIITSIVALLPVLVGLLFWNRLPDPMATHFGFDNKADGFSGKALAVFGIPLFLLAMHILVAFVTSADPRKQNISPKIYRMVLWIIPVVSLFAAATVYPYNLGIELNIGFIAMLLMGMLFLVIGNFLPKARQNYTIGVRVPWTLANEENWNRTHRLAGHIWVVAGILMILAAFAGNIGMIAFFVLTFAAALVPIVYSFWLHQRQGL